MPPTSKALLRQAACVAEALRRLQSAVAQGHPADAEIARHFREHRELGSRDRRLISETCFAFFRWRGWLPDGDPATQCALARALDELSPHPAFQISDSDVANAKSKPERQLVPDWLPAELPPELEPLLIRSFQIRPPVWLRARRGEEQNVLNALAKSGVAATAHARFPQAIRFTGSANLDLIRKECGPVFEVQDFASQRVGHFCGAMPGERWLDLCAGSGGKSLHLADLTEGRGEIVGTDPRESALREFERRRKAANAGNIRIVPPGSSFDEASFDGVLVDAPCSGTGTWGRNPDARWRTTAGDVAEMAKLQLELLNRAIHYVKPGGALVFAVCAVTRSETVRILEQFAAQEPQLGCPAVFKSRPWDEACDGMFAARWVAP